MGPQLIFTTHDTTLLDANLLRRDQIWFVEKDAEQSTKLYPLLDYRPRKDEALERGYMKGRYGAVPMFERSAVSTCPVVTFQTYAVGLRFGAAPANASHARLR